MSQNTYVARPTPVTVVDILCARARRQPDQLAYLFLLDGETKEARLTYRELDQQARAIAARLQRVGGGGERVLLLYPPGLDYIAAFFGCLYAGMIAVPAYPPNPMQLERTLPRLQAIAASAQPLAALTTAAILPFARALSAQDSAFQAMQWMATDDGQPAEAEHWQVPALTGTSLAFFQYTSGSTATPKGVMLTHDNLLHNSALILRCFGHTPASQGVIWLPPYHDMGLIGGILQPLYAGFPVALLSPIDFLQQPLRWLRAVSRYRATTSGGPNFAYELCVRKITAAERATLDLSSWQVAFNGAEPIRAETMDAFARTFAPCGFRPEAFYPCYGLAEATLLVSGGEKLAAPIIRMFRGAALEHNRVQVPAADDQDPRPLVGCGQPLPDQVIVVADPASATQCPPGQIGEIWISGPSVAQGYWDQPVETERAFGAYLADSGAGPFLRTGDLGFLSAGQLFITGRLKDLIIIRGRNHYPHDIELTVEKSHPALRAGGGAAFSIEAAHEERLVVVQELERRVQQVDVEEVAAAIRQAVARAYELHIHAVVLIKPGSLPKTSSGKVQRHACRTAFLDDRLEVVGRSMLGADAADQPDETEAPVTSAALQTVSDPEARRALMTRYLQEQIGNLLSVAAARIDPRRPLSAFGLDSLMAIELKHNLERELGVTVPMVAFLDGTGIAQLAAGLLEARGSGTAKSAPQRRRTPDQQAPLSFAQQRLWFLHQLEPASAAYNISAAVRLRGSLHLRALWHSLAEVPRRHEILRTTFPTMDGQPVQHIAPALALSLPVLALHDLPQREREDVALRLAHEEARRPFALACGPLIRAALIQLAAEEHILLLTMHHIVSDGWSMNVLVREIAALYESFLRGRPAPLPELPIQYADYAVWQRTWLQGDKETRPAPSGNEGRQGDKETRRRLETPSPTPNTQHPTPIEAQLAYWKTRLAGATTLELPTDHPRPPVQTFRGASYTFEIAPELRDALDAVSLREEVTLFMTLLAAFQTLLSRYSGQSDVLVGSPIAGRTHAELGGLIGFFVNTLVLRTDLSGDPSFGELLGRVREVALGAYAHQDLPFEQLVEALQPERHLNHTPVFQVLFALRSGPPLAQRLPGLVLELLEIESGAAKFDLTLEIEQTERRLNGSFRYAADLFAPPTIMRMATHFRQLLEGIVAYPQRRLSELPLLTAAERQQLLVEWNATGSGVGGQGSGVRSQHSDCSWCVHELFEAQAVCTPDAVAVVFEGRTTTARGQGPGVRGQEDKETRSQESGVRSQELDDGERQTQNSKPWPEPGRRLKTQNYSPNTQHPTPNTQHLTYYELNRRANQLAHVLQAAGIGPDRRVGLWIERSLELMVALLGVLKSGGSYVPLDPTYPQERLAFMLEDSQAAVLITTNDQRPTTNDRPPLHPFTPSGSEVDLRADWRTIARGCADNPTSGVRPENLAYVIYTSGSTGRPKGVAVEHRQLVNYIRAILDRLELPADASFATVSTFAADLGNTMIFPPLCSGGCLHVIAQERVFDPDALAEYFRRSPVDCLKIVPSHLAALLASSHSRHLLPGLLVLGGEAASWALIDQVQEQRPDCRIINHYGPTETTVGVLTCPVARGHTGTRGAALPLGRPLANTQIYILDAHLQPVPVGVPGQLYVGGHGLARGYLDRPDLTAERFIPNPFAGVLGDGCWVTGAESSNTQHPTPVTRLYKTGDLARYRPNGVIEFLGRIDHQVKIRGFRVELGEIEAVLRQHPPVREAVVLAREDTPGDTRLVAYVVPHREQGTGDRGQEGSVSDTAFLSPVTYHLSPGELRAFLQGKLPPFMVPSSFALVPALPITSNGKVDLPALLRIAPAAPETAETFVAPRTEVEQSLGQVWQTLLRVERVGIHDNFFDLGGHSLLMVQLQKQIKDRFLREVPLLEIMKHPTISALATYITRTDGDSAQPSVQESQARAETRLSAMQLRRQHRQNRK